MEDGRRAFRGRSEALALGAELDAAQVAVGCDVERRAVVPPAAVGCGHARLDGAEVLPLGRKDEDTPRSGGEDIALVIDAQAVRQALFLLGHRGGVEEYLAV